MPLADASDPTAQYVPVAGGSSKAEVLLNIRELLKPGAKLYLERVIFHEGVPGHHLADHASAALIDDCFESGALECVLRRRLGSVRLKSRR